MAEIKIKRLDSGAVADAARAFRDTGTDEASYVLTEALQALDRKVGEA